MKPLRAGPEDRLRGSAGDTPLRRPARPEPPPEKPRRRKAPDGGGPTLTRLLVRAVLVVGIWAVMGGLAVLAYYAHDLPDTSEVVQYRRRPAITLVDASGTQFARFGELQGTLLDVKAMPPDLVNAVLAIEDRRFYGHFGVDPIGLARAFYVNWRSGRTVQGGSTLTQQLAKNLFLSTERTLKRKVQEALLALWLEHKYTKDQILTAYLNRVYLGAGTFGVDAAARTYFYKPATELTLREAAIIAGLLKAPSRFAPSANPAKAQERAAVVLSAMVDAGYITQDQAAGALKVAVVPGRKPGSEGDGRYYGAWVADQVAAFVGPDHGDLVVRTTFDPAVQRAAESRVSDMLRGPGAAAKVSQAAAVVMAYDGAVRALVGGRDYDESQFNRATQAMRQPGSSFKPFVYLAALEAGRQPDDLVLDAPYTKGKWSPGNYDGKFHGEVTLRYALSHSLNTATVRLLEEAGVDRARSVAKRLGMTSPLRRDLSLALGTSEVTLLELTGAYGAIANGGQAVLPYAIVSIQDMQGEVLYQRRGSGAGYPVSAPDVAALTRMMMGVLESGTGTAARLDRMAAGKTGTTQDYKDAWFVGFTADMVAGVWLGNDDGSSMKRITGGSLPARLWHDIMTDAHAGLPARALPSLNQDTPRPDDLPAVAAGDSIGEVIAAQELPPEGTEMRVDASAGPPPEEGGDSLGDLIKRLTEAP